MPTRLYFSTAIESLAGQFARDISSIGEWAEPCMVIVPNPYIQKWLLLETARINGIAMNIRFRLLNDGLWEILEENDPEKPLMIQQTAFRLLLYYAVQKLRPSDGNAASLAGYLFDTAGDRKSDYEQRVWQLSVRLARYYQEYEIYREEMIDAWLNGELLYNTEMESAQRYIYLSLFKEGGIGDSLQYTPMTLPRYWRRIRSHPFRRGISRLFIFGETRLSPFHASMIHELGRELDITMYQVNPCSEFWEDVTTPGEDRWKRIRSISVDLLPDGEILSANEIENPLLKFWGKTGRETIKLLSLLEDAGSTEMRFLSEWIDQNEPITGDTCLDEIRRQVVGRFSSHGKNKTIRQDTSIQVASSPDLYRETEAVYNSIVHNLSQDPDLMMTDIAVMVPDMPLYGPVIESVFSRDPRRISYSIIDSTAVTDSLFGKAVRSILDIASGSFTRKEIFELIYNQCFLEARSLTARDADVWLEWVDSLQIFRVFNRPGGTVQELNLYTWEQGLRRLRLGRIMIPHPASDQRDNFPDYRGVVPYTDMYSQDRDLLDSFSMAIELLHEKTSRLKLLHAPGSEWSSIISELIDEFLVVPTSLPEESFIRTRLLDALRHLSLMDRFPDNASDVACSLSFVREYIDEHLASIPSTRGSYLTGGINVSALIPNRQIPFKIVYIMGMQEGVFPGTADTSTLNLMTIKRKIGDVTRPDLNRYLFLETLLSVRNKLYITYLSKDLQKDQDFYPNSTVAQFLTYLNSHVLNDDFVIAQIPATGFSAEYLNADGAILSGSDIIASIDNGNYRPAVYGISDRLLLLEKAFVDSDRAVHQRDPINELIVSMTPDFSPPGNSDSPTTDKISLSLKDLYYFLLNPSESALRWRLSIYDEDEKDVSLLEDEPFFSSPRSHFHFITQALNHYILTGGETDIRAYIEALYRHLHLKSMTPDGAFAVVDYDQIQEAVIKRIHFDGGLETFLRERKNFPLIRNVTFGSPSPHGEPEVILPSLTSLFERESGTIQVDISGHLPFLWKNPDTGGTESLVITNSASPSPSHVLSPFLFYAAAASGLNPELSREIGEGIFTIHVSYKKGIASFTYDRSGQEYASYFLKLLADFLDPSSFDLLPLVLIAGSRIIKPTEMKQHPDRGDVEQYRRSLIRLISDDKDGPFPSFRPMKILDITDCDVPEDAYEKVRDRLAIPLSPFFGV